MVGFGWKTPLVLFLVIRISTSLPAGVLWWDLGGKSVFVPGSWLLQYPLVSLDGINEILIQLCASPLKQEPREILVN